MAEANWLVPGSAFFTEDEKELILVKLQNRINKEGYLIVKSSESRSQLDNKQIALKKMLDMVNKSIIVPKKRKPSKIPKGVKEKRLDNKRRDSEKKKNRKKDW